MSVKKNLSKVLILFILLSLPVITLAQDRLFTYTYQSTVLNKGQRELEIWNTFSTGRVDYYSRLDNRTEFEVGLGNKMQTSFYLNLTTITQTNEAIGVKSTTTEHEISFSNEWKLKLMDPVANPIGLALYTEYSIGSNEYEIEGKLILDKKIDNLTIAANTVYEAEFAPVYKNNKLEWEKENKIEYYLALGYSLNPKLHISMENAFRNVYVDNKLEHSALFAGFGFSYIQDNFWLNLTVLPQIKSFKGEGNNTLNLNEYEKIEFRLLFSYAF